MVHFNSNKMSKSSRRTLILANSMKTSIKRKSITEGISMKKTKRRMKMCLLKEVFSSKNGKEDLRTKALGMTCSLMSSMF